MAALRAHEPGSRVTLADHRLEVAALGAIWQHITGLLECAFRAVIPERSST
jgi:hypothetical protein